MELKKQRTLKAKVNRAIRQIGDAHAGKRRVVMVLKQSGLKAKCNKEIRSREYYLKPLTSQQQVRSQMQSMDMSVNNRHTQNLLDRKLFENISSCSDTESKKQRAVMRLVEHVMKASERKDQQDKYIRTLNAVVAQQKADFASLNMRAVEDKNRLYERLEDLKEENQMLTELLAKLEREELVKAFQKIRAKEIKGRNNQQRLQATHYYQEMQELSKNKQSRDKTQHGQFRMPNDR